MTSLHFKKLTTFSAAANLNPSKNDQAGRRRNDWVIARWLYAAEWKQFLLCKTTANYLQWHHECKP
ncbi:hypothetical protein N9A86_02120 [Akkermansiaceae bacterium]|nr:hypothetical protein [Akkermansiaceae bacterium]MDB4537956.1 hypothetical protein [Akkermansiaceae bacterium]